MISLMLSSSVGKKHTHTNRLYEYIQICGKTNNEKREYTNLLIITEKRVGIASKGDKRSFRDIFKVPTT